MTSQCAWCSTIKPLILKCLLGMVPPYLMKLHIKSLWVLYIDKTRFMLLWESYLPTMHASITTHLYVVKLVF